MKFRHAFCIIFVSCFTSIAVIIPSSAILESLDIYVKKKKYFDFSFEINQVAQLLLISSISYCCRWSTGAAVNHVPNEIHSTKNAKNRSTIFRLDAAKNPCIMISNLISAKRRFAFAFRSIRTKAMKRISNNQEYKQKIAG